MRRCWLCLGVLAGCGRFGFGDGSRTDAARDDARDAGDAAMVDAPICHTGTFGTPQPITSTLSSSEEANPTISTDELTLYFSSNRGSATRKLWSVTRMSRSDAFGTPAPLMGTGLVSTADDRDPGISSDGLALYFSSRRSGNELIYVATRPDSSATFTLQGQLAIAGDTSTQQGGPSVSPDELTLYYAFGQAEVALATRTSPTGSFTFVRLVSEVNSPPTETSPSISADGLELFFDSYRLGPATIYEASRASTTDSFSSPTPLPALANGNVSAGTPAISADGRTLYYNISDGTQIDLYAATRDCL